ncbi:MAG: class I SAM-dependent methyltransferase [Flavobacteriales bacterium]
MHTPSPAIAIGRTGIFAAMTLEKRTCPACGHASGTLLPAYAAHHLRRCPRCGCAYVDRVPTSTELDTYYGDYPIKDAPPAVTIKRYGELLDDLEVHHRTGRLIDVGCGGGGFLRCAAERGWEAHGTEYGAATVETLREQGFHMRQGPLDAANYEAGSFDVVVSIEVLEHVIDPREELRQMHRILRPGGLLYITTPNFNALTRRLTGSRWTVVAYPEHLTLFTAASLHGLLERSGFERIGLRTTGISLSRIKESHGIGDAEANRTAADDARLQHSIEGSAILRTAKSMANGVLSLVRLGDTLKATYRKKG